MEQLSRVRRDRSGQLWLLCIPCSLKSIPRIQFIAQSLPHTSAQGLSTWFNFVAGNIFTKDYRGKVLGNGSINFISKFCSKSGWVPISPLCLYADSPRLQSWKSKLYNFKNSKNKLECLEFLVATGSIILIGYKFIQTPISFLPIYPRLFSEMQSYV